MLPDAVGWAVLIGLAIAFSAWLARHAPRVPRVRLALAIVTVAAVLGWAVTIRYPAEKVHLLLFGTLGITSVLAFGLRTGLVVVLVYAGGDELIQLYLADRVADRGHRVPEDLELPVVVGDEGHIGTFACCDPSRSSSPA